MSLITRLCQAFARKKLRYAIVGGYAVALHGAVRGTVDVDIALNWNLKSLQIAEQVLSELGLESRLPISALDVFQFREEYIQNRNLIAWNFHNPKDPTEQVDIIMTGLMRPHDVTADNLIDSSRISDFKVSYNSKGDLRDGTRPGWFWRILQFINPF